MKKLLLATTLIAAFGSAQALPILSYSPYAGEYDLTEGTVFNFSGTKLNQAITGTTFTNGALYSGFKGGSLQVDLAPANLKFTYLGKQAGHKNSFTYDFGGSSQNGFFTTDIRGTNFEARVSEEGYLELMFKDVTTSKQAFSGYAETNPYNSWFGFLEVSEIDFGDGAGEYDYLILFNDDYSDNDYNDMAVGVRAVPDVRMIPEPETYALMLAGLGVVGFMARRRRQA